MGDVLVFKKIPDELDAFEGDLVLSIIGSDEKPLRSTNAWIDWRLYGTVSELMVRGHFSAKAGEKCMLPTYGRFNFDRVVLIGGDEIFSEAKRPDRSLGEAHWREIIRSAEETLSSLKVERAGLSLPRFENSEEEKALIRVLQSSHLPKQTSLFLSRASSYVTPLGI